MFHMTSWPMQQAGLHNKLVLGCSDYTRCHTRAISMARSASLHCNVGEAAGRTSTEELALELQFGFVGAQGRGNRCASISCREPQSVLTSASRKLWCGVQHAETSARACHERIHALERLLVLISASYTAVLPQRLSALAAPTRQARLQLSCLRRAHAQRRRRATRRHCGWAARATVQRHARVHVCASVCVCACACACARAGASVRVRVKSNWPRTPVFTAPPTSLVQRAANYWVWGDHYFFVNFNMEIS